MEITKEEKFEERESYKARKGDLAYHMTGQAAIYL